MDVSSVFRYDVLLTLPQDQLYTYTSNQHLELGAIVEVPFGKRRVSGVVWNETPTDYHPSFQLKPIDHMWPLPPLSIATRKLIEWASRYYMSFKGHFVKMTLTGLPDKDYRPRKKYGNFVEPKDCPRDFPLTPHQSDAVDHIREVIRKGTHCTFLLDGVTGSGKTEVYYEALLEAIRQKRQVLILLPEITLTQQWLDRFKHRFGVLPARWHSSLKQTERLHTWQQILKGHASVVVGARSALFLPFQNLGLIVVDEEQDGSYKQDEGIHYNARDLAVVRSTLESCPLVLASATPSIESYHNAKDGKYTLLSLTERFGSAGTPTAHIIDLRQKSEQVGRGQYVSRSLIQAIENCIQRQEQAILFLNRRGFAPLTLCTECGHKVSCPDCSANLVHHRSHSATPVLQCHHCGLSIKAMNDCSECGSVDSLREWGVGIERLTQEVQEKCPTARIMTVSSDHMTHLDHLDTLYQALQQHTVDIVIGTQLMAKGHDFSNVTLVGIIDADAGFMAEDIRAAEHTYQLLHQVAGRCGRGHKPGHVYIQTFAPTYPVINALKTFNRDAFLQLELQNRKMGYLPPFSRQASLIVSGEDEAQVKLLCNQLFQRLPSQDQVMVFGPAPAPLFKLRGKYRYRFLVQGAKQALLQPYIQQWLSNVSISKTIKLTIDIDPISFY
jgi:primosomal protein N' (replication factor Y)